jgi:hypothetical protein
VVNPQTDIPDAAHGRVAHVKARLRRPLSLIAPPAIFGLVLLGEGPPGDAALSALIAAGVVVVLAVRGAVKAAREDFFASYASSRGLDRRVERELPEATPLLRMGTGRHAERLMAGVLPGGLQGVIALYTYEEAREGDRRAQTRRFTIVLHRLPEVIDRLVELHCVPAASAAVSGIEGFRRRNRLQLESVVLDRRYEIFFGPDDDENFLRRLYAPSFIVWLGEQAAPPGFGFQLTQGHLCAFVPGHLGNAAQLDALCQSAAVVATRLADEVAESRTG